MFIKDDEMILERKLTGPYPPESYLTVTNMFMMKILI